VPSPSRPGERDVEDVAELLLVSIKCVAATAQPFDCGPTGERSGLHGSRNAGPGHRMGQACRITRQQRRHLADPAPRAKPAANRNDAAGQRAWPRANAARERELDMQRRQQRLETLAVLKRDADPHVGKGPLRE
jgi:hypothetical protein